MVKVDPDERTFTFLGKVDGTLRSRSSAVDVGEVVESAAKHAMRFPVFFLTFATAVEAVLATRARLAWLSADGATFDERRHLIIVRKVNSDRR